MREGTRSSPRLRTQGPGLLVALALTLTATQGSGADEAKAKQVLGDYPWIYEQEAAFDSIRDDPAFQALMARVRAGWEGMRARVPPELVDGR